MKSSVWTLALCQVPYWPSVWFKHINRQWDVFHVIMSLTQRLIFFSKRDQGRLTRIALCLKPCITWPQMTQLILSPTTAPSEPTIPTRTSSHHPRNNPMPYSKRALNSCCWGFLHTLHLLAMGSWLSSSVFLSQFPYL